VLQIQTVKKSDEYNISSKEIKLSDHWLPVTPRKLKELALHESVLAYLYRAAIPQGRVKLG